MLQTAINKIKRGNLQEHQTPTLLQKQDHHIKEEEDPKETQCHTPISLCHHPCSEGRMPQEDENSEIMITFLRKELEASLEKNGSLEKENHELRREVSRLKEQITSLKAHNLERKSVLWKKFQNSMDTPEQSPAAKEKMCSKLDFTEEKSATILISAPPPKAPPTPPASIKEFRQNKGPSAPAPPPPPPPSKSLLGSKGVRRVPEVIELYRSLTRKDAHMENKANPAGVHVFALTKNMIGEIENRSSYVLAVSI
jgi:hypothetical protein